MSEGQVRLHIQDAVASVVFDRPEARNAMTWAMYESLVAICGQLHKDASVRVVRFRGAGNVKMLTPPNFRTPSDFESYDPKESVQVDKSRGRISGVKTFEYVVHVR